MKPVANTLDTMHDAQAILSYGVESEEQVKNCTYSLDRAYFNQGKNAQYNPSVSVETTQTIVSKGPNAVGARDSKGVGIVRRLTPIECERLQGFPSGWTDIGEWVDSKGKKHKEADSPRYKALGNSIALPFWFWLLRRISATYSRRATLGSLFSGIGGFEFCWEMCNGKGTARWASEIEKFPIEVTKYHFPE
jgi:site-specific DNA-cytosine methylase